MFLKKIYDYFSLTKPSIMLLVVVTGATALVLEGSLLSEPVKFLLVILALYLTGGSANALNQYFERETDALMKRTSKRRPLPQNKISPLMALIFSVSIGLIGVAIFIVFFNWLSALLAFGTLLFYSLLYTLFLKPNTSQNIVVGGAAGAMAPVGAWVAASGTMDITPWILFLIIFLWTPPHFWALALFYQDDYIAAKLPMLPVVKGVDSTLTQIIFYTWLLVGVSLAMLISGKIGIIYTAVALLTGVQFLRKSYQARQFKTIKTFRSLFGYSITYLFVLFIAVIVDGII